MHGGVPPIKAQIWDCGELLLNFSPKKWHTLEEEVQIKMIDNFFQKMPKLQVVLSVNDFEIKISHLTIFGEPGLSRIPMPMRSRPMASPSRRASSSSEAQGLPKSAKKILADLIMSLADIDLID